jgi:UTP--glucose-1-phosphate uridylyltransferase
MGVEPRTLVIPAAGLGTRMKCVDPHLPKAMLPVGPQPAIQYAVAEGLHAGIERIVIIISPRAESTREHFSRFDHPITFLYQEEPKGEADAIALAEGIVGEGALAVIYPDNIHLPAPGALRPLVDAYRRHGHDVIALTTITKEIASCYGNSGAVDLVPSGTDMHRIERLHSKGPGRFQPRWDQELRACGILVCGSHLFDAIREARESIDDGEELTDEPVLERIAREGRLLGIRLPGTVYDIGSPEGYELCRKVLGGRSPEAERCQGRG